MVYWGVCPPETFEACRERDKKPRKLFSDAVKGPQQDPKPADAPQRNLGWSPERGRSRYRYPK